MAEHVEKPGIASLCSEWRVFVSPPLAASHSLTTLLLRLKKEKSSLAIARANLTDPQFIDEMYLINMAHRFHGQMHDSR